MSDRSRRFFLLGTAEAKWGYKWARWVTEIELSDDPNFRGYWESRGFSHSGDYPGPLFEKR